MENNGNLNIDGGPNHPSGLFINPDLINENYYLKEQIFNLQSSMKYHMDWFQYYQIENTELKKELGDAQAQIINLEEKNKVQEEGVKKLTKKNSAKIDELYRTLKNSIKNQEGIMNSLQEEIQKIKSQLENSALYKITNSSTEKIEMQKNIINDLEPIPETENPLENNMLHEITKSPISSLSSANEKLSYSDVIKNCIKEDLEKKSNEQKFAYQISYADKSLCLNTRQKVIKIRTDDLNFIRNLAKLYIVSTCNNLLVLVNASIIVRKKTDDRTYDERINKVRYCGWKENTKLYFAPYSISELDRQIDKNLRVDQGFIGDVTIASPLDQNYKEKICNICNLDHIVDFQNAVKNLMNKKVGSTLTLEDLKPLNSYVNQILEGHYKDGMAIDKEKSSFSIY